VAWPSCLPADRQDDRTSPQSLIVAAPLVNAIAGVRPGPVAVIIPKVPSDSRVLVHSQAGEPSSPADGSF
jgi:hypothetical protein